MSTIYNSYDSSITEYDAVFDKASALMHEASMLYTAFVSEILKRAGCDIQIQGYIIPLYTGENYAVREAERLYIEGESEIPHILFTNGESFPFAEITVSAQETLAMHIYMEIKTADMHRSLFGNSETT